jgi:hypothetical protein
MTFAKGVVVSELDAEEPSRDVNRPVERICLKITKASRPKEMAIAMVVKNNNMSGRATKVERGKNISDGGDFATTTAF